MPRLTIAGELRKGIHNRSLAPSWDDQGGGQCRMTFLLLDGLAKPVEGQEAIVYEDDLSTVIWAGLIEGINPERQVGRGQGAIMAYDLVIGGYRRLARRKTALQRYISRSAGFIVRDLLRRYCPGLVIDDALIDDGPIVAEWVVNWEYPDDSIATLAKDCGFYYDTDFSRRVIFKPMATNRAPFDLTPTSMNFADLEITTDRTQLKNSILVRGGMYPGPLITELFTGTGEIDTGANFPLSREPFDSGWAPLLTDNFGGNTIASDWAVTEPGTVFAQVDDVLSAYGSMTAWGLAGVISKALFDRKPGRRMELDLYPIAGGDYAFGWHDGSGVDASDLVHGFKVSAGGALSVVEGGIEHPAWLTIGLETDYRLRITLQEEGAIYQIQGGEFGASGSNSWTTIEGDWPAASQRYMAVAPLLFKSGEVYVDNLTVRDAPQGVTLLIDGVPRVVGIENVDEGNGVDAIVAVKDRMLRFFDDNYPAKGAEIVLQYRPAVPVITRVKDLASIRAVAAIEGGDGEIQATIIDRTLDSLEAARRAGRRELEEYSNPRISATYNTLSRGLRPGMIQRVSVRGLDQDFKVVAVSASDIGTGQDGPAMRYDITLGSRLLGLEDYLRDLIAKGKRIERQPGEQMDDYADHTDQIATSDHVTTLLSTEGLGPGKVGSVRVGYWIV